jgi:hypothetical protein
MPVQGLERWGHCCGEKGCIHPIWQVGEGSEKPANWIGRGAKGLGDFNPPFWRSSISFWFLITEFFGVSVVWFSNPFITLLHTLYIPKNKIVRYTKIVDNRISTTNKVN